VVLRVMGWRNTGGRAGHVIALAMRHLGWHSAYVLDGKPMRIWVRRKFPVGRPKGSRDAKPRTRRWKVKPAGA
jgi:hypothetical protein